MGNLIMSSQTLRLMSTRTVAIVVMACLGWSTLGLAGELGNDTNTTKWHPWFEIGGYYNSLLSACRIVELFAGGRC